MQILKLTKITLLDRPDFQTRSFYERTTKWLGSWTIENNYDMVLVIDHDDHGVAFRIWRKSLLDSFSSALGELTPSDGLVNHFVFNYVIHNVAINNSCKYYGSGQVNVSDIQDEEESVPETELTELGKACET